MSASPVVILDDDPTGAQLSAGIPVLFEWSQERLQRLADDGVGAMHLMTNSRALDGEGARAIVADAAAAARRAFADPFFVLRGDSTLRGHLLEEYEALSAAAFESDPVLLLVPALPHAGRVTEGGVHYLVAGGRRTPLHETEYARDGGFAYADARLLRWAHDRSSGRLGVAAGLEVAAGDVAGALVELSRSGGPAVCVPDASTIDDLRLIAAGLRDARARGASVAVRCAPAFAAVLAGALAEEHVAPPTAERGVLVLCGSHVPTTSRQLERLRQELGIVVHETDVDRLIDEVEADGEVRRLAALARVDVGARGFAVVATPRARRQLPLADGKRLAVGLARVLEAVRPAVDVVVAKGGITSHVVVERGLTAREALVVGPIADGVSRWEVTTPEGPVACIVVPGNVGEDDLLTRVVAAVGAARC